MKLMKVFLTSEMTDDVFKFLCTVGSFVEDGYGHYVVGAFVKEADADPINYDLLKKLMPIL